MTGSDYLLMQAAHGRIDAMHSQAKQDSSFRQAARELRQLAVTQRNAKTAPVAKITFAARIAFAVKTAFAAFT